MFYYAQLNGENICTAISKSPGEIFGSNMISLSKFDSSLLGKRYNDGEWVDEPAPEPQPTQLDKIQTAQLTIMAAMADQYEESLEKDLRNMDVQATIYEAILELGGAE